MKTSGYLTVSNTHNIYYEVLGENAEGRDTILFVHGGPGAGFTENDKRFFNFNIQKVIFFDQRGASKSTPFGSIVDNTTQHLVNDITQLLDHLHEDLVCVFGGSWGTTLSLVYAIQHPDRVKGLLLRGVYLGDKVSIDHYLGGGIKEELPIVWDRFCSHVPYEHQESIANYYLTKMLYGSSSERQLYTYEWAFYEISMFKKTIDAEEVDTILKQYAYESLAIMEAHYLSNACFLEDDYILNNLAIIAELPVTIVHGKDDIICPVRFAVELDSKLHNSKLYIEEGGHSDSEPAIEKRLMTLIETGF